MLAEARALTVSEILKPQFQLPVRWLINLSIGYHREQ